MATSDKGAYSRSFGYFRSVLSRSSASESSRLSGAVEEAAGLGIDVIDTLRRAVTRQQT
jgi:hypothetical protein